MQRAVNNEKHTAEPSPFTSDDIMDKIEKVGSKMIDRHANVYYWYVSEVHSVEK